MDDNHQWDGSEAELVADDEAEEYEIPETGIRISFALTQEEMYQCLQHSGLYKTKGTRAIIESMIFGIAAVAFVISYFLIKNEYRDFNLFFGVLCLIMIGVIWIIPHFHIKNLARNMANGKIIEAEIYQSHIDIGSGSGAWSIELDGSCELEEFDNIFMIAVPDGKNFAIPQRVIEPEIYNELKAILVSGTSPKE